MAIGRILYGHELHMFLNQQPHHGHVQHGQRIFLFERYAHQKYRVPDRRDSHGTIGSQHGQAKFNKRHWCCFISLRQWRKGAGRILQFGNSAVNGLSLLFALLEFLLNRQE